MINLEYQISNQRDTDTPLIRISVLRNYHETYILTSILPKSRREAEEQNTRTSYIEYEVDASVLKADEGRGDRRNVQGELQASDEP